MTSVPRTAESSEIGALTCAEPLKTWAGHGTGSTCNGCGVSIHSSEIEYEVELAGKAGSARTARSLHFHLACYRTWMSRRRP